MERMERILQVVRSMCIVTAIASIIFCTGWDSTHANVCGGGVISELSREEIAKIQKPAGTYSRFVVTEYDENNY